MSYITVEHLCKSFTVRKKREGGSLLRVKETVEALKDVCFSVEKGELVGYIGPNGAGKSTTVKILSGILTPDSGSVRVGGRVPWLERKEHVRRIGEGQAGGIDLGGQFLRFELFISGHHQQVIRSLLPVAEEQVLADDHAEYGVDGVARFHGIGRFMIRPQVTDSQAVEKIIRPDLTEQASFPLFRAALMQFH